MSSTQLPSPTEAAETAIDIKKHSDKYSTMQFGRKDDFNLEHPFNMPMVIIVLVAIAICLLLIIWNNKSNTDDENEKERFNQNIIARNQAIADIKKNNIDEKLVGIDIKRELPFDEPVDMCNGNAA